MQPIRTGRAIAWAGNETALATIVGCSRHALACWGKFVPERYTAELAAQMRNHPNGAPGSFVETLLRAGRTDQAGAVAFTEARQRDRDERVARVEDLERRRAERALRWKHRAAGA